MHPNIIYTSKSSNKIVLTFAELPIGAHFKLVHGPDVITDTLRLKVTNNSYDVILDGDADESEYLFQVGKGDVRTLEDEVYFISQEDVDDYLHGA